MGFGTGLITRELIAAGVSVEVLEGSPRLAAHARSAHPGLIVHVGMFETFQPADPFDAVLALHVLAHVDDQVALLGHLRSWLPPGRRPTVRTPNPPSPPR